MKCLDMYDAENGRKPVVTHTVATEQKIGRTYRNNDLFILFKKDIHDAMIKVSLGAGT